MDIEGKIIFLTGATGSLGYHILESLVGLKVTEVRCLVRNNSKIFHHKNLNLSIVEGDLSDSFLINDNLKDVDIVIHCAAKVHSNVKNIDEYYHVNVEQTKTLFDSCIKNKVSRVVYISSVAVYGNDTVVHEGTITKPHSHYGKSKLLAEEEGLRLFSKSGLPLTILQLSTLFGSKDRGNFKTLMKFSLNGFMPLIGNGHNIKTITYVKDAVNAILLTIGNDNTIGERLIIADPSSRRMIDLIRDIEKVISKKIMILPIPMIALSFISKILMMSGVGNNYLYKLTAVTKETKYNTSKSMNYLGDYVEYGFLNGLKDSINWYKTEILKMN